MRHLILSVFLLPVLIQAETIYCPPCQEEIDQYSYVDRDEGVCAQGEDENSEYFWYAEPYEGDVDEMWYWEDEPVYPTKRDNTWVDELTKPW